MSKKAKRLGIVFSATLLLFIASFFDLIPLNAFISGLLLFASLLFRAVTDGPEQTRLVYKKYIIGGCLLASLILGLAMNLYEGLSLFILSVGILYTLRSLNSGKHNNIFHNSRDYCIHAAFGIVYFIGFAIGAHIIGSNDSLILDCKDIYSNYQQVTNWFGKPAPMATSASLSRSDKLFAKASIVTDSYPQLQSLLQKIKSYEQDISSSISDQQKINQEICVLVTARIHDIYDQGNIKVGLVLLIGLFLYPFFIVLIYLYGLLSYLMFRIALHYKLFSYVKKMVEKTELE